MIAVAGLVANAVGIFLMLRYGLPASMPLPRIGVVLQALTAKETREEERRKAIGMVGLLLLIVGTLLQIVAALAGKAVP